MEVTSMHLFLNYYEKTRQQTLRVIQAIPEDKLDWTYKQGKFTCGDLIRHIGAIERNLFAEVVQGNKPKYMGCGKEIMEGYPNVHNYFSAMHQQSIEIFRTLRDESLSRMIRSLDGKEIQLGNFLRALIVHEVHHRGALCIYLNLFGVESPPVIGLKEEEVIQISNSSAL
jgi:uncharacterized damage-inducible protein DinB